MAKSTDKILEYQRKIRKELKEKGFCHDCRASLSIADEGRTRCSNCRVKDRERTLSKIRSRRQNGLCLCGAIACVGNKLRLCETCWFKHISRLRTGSNKNWLAIRQLLKTQNYRCPYTGELLTIGKNASLDHIYPLHKFPSLKNDLSNFEWVAREINEMKRNRTPEEFLSLIQHILNHHRSAPCVSQEAVCFS